MKTFKQLVEENQLNEGGEMYPGDEMTMKELKVACYAAQNILDRLEDGSMIQRWQISAIVKAAEELASVYTSMSADDDEEEMWDDEEDSGDMYYDEYGYPRMYGEATVDTYHSLMLKALGKSRLPKDHGFTSSVANNGDFVVRDGGGRVVGRIGKGGYNLKEEADFEVDVEGLPKMYVKGDSASEVKAGLRKIVKKPDMIRGIERVTRSTVQKIFRDKASGKPETEE
jgi:hypothetical protein